MAKKPAAETKPSVPQPGAAFVDLMLVAADFVKARGGMGPAKEALEDAGKFIERAGGVAAATDALKVLESLKSKISE